jgi:hypothetical protein
MPKVECVDCKARPTFDVAWAEAMEDVESTSIIEMRPKVPRPIDPRSGPRSPRCYTHYRARQQAARATKAVTQRKLRHGITDEEHGELLAEQGGTCPCGNKVGHVDHDHLIARTLCDHREDWSCERCRRGLLCHSCNSDILGRGYTRSRLLALVAYLDDPPMARIRRRELERLEGA